MKRKPLVPKGLRDWPDAARDIAPEQVRSMYEHGFAGAIHDEAAYEELYASVQWPEAEEAASEFGLVGSGKGKLSLPYLPAYKHWPKCWPAPGQTTGDCVSRAAANSGLILIGVECELGQPDPETGKVEGFPGVSEEAERNGVVASEPSYGDRGHTGEGASCERLIQHMTKDGGVILRRNYQDAGVDLTRYNSKIGQGWGRSGTPDSIRALGREHRIRTATQVSTVDAAIDFVANGYPLWICSGLGFSNKRDENGFSVQSGSWAHSWIVMAVDDRDTTRQKYGEALGLFRHEWGIWNTGGRRIMGTDIDIPEGSFWFKLSLLNRCDTWAMSNLNGWPRRDLPDWSIGWN